MTKKELQEELEKELLNKSFKTNEELEMLVRNTVAEKIRIELGLDLNEINVLHSKRENYVDIYYMTNCPEDNRKFMEYSIVDFSYNYVREDFRRCGHAFKITKINVNYDENETTQSVFEIIKADVQKKTEKAKRVKRLAINVMRYLKTLTDSSIEQSVVVKKLNDSFYEIDALTDDDK